MEYDYQAQMWRPKTTQPPSQSIPSTTSEPIPDQVSSGNTGDVFELNSANNYGIDPNETPTGNVMTPTTTSPPAAVPVTNQLVTPVPNTNQDGLNSGIRRPNQNWNSYPVPGVAGTGGNNGPTPDTSQANASSDWKIEFPTNDAQYGGYSRYNTQQTPRTTQTAQNNVPYRQNRQNYNNYYGR